MTDAAAGLHQRFLLEDRDIRGELIHLGPLWRAITSRRPYGPQLAALLGEFATLASVVAAGLKAPGRVVLQVMGDGPVALAVADCSHDLHLRALVKPAAGASIPEDIGVRELFANGRLALTVENHATGRHAQSIVPLEAHTLAECFERYFDLSEQVPTHVWVETTAQSVTGLVLQKLPGADRRDPLGWARVQHEAARQAPRLLASAAPAQGGLASLVSALFPEEAIRLFAARELSDGCSRSEEKVIGMLRALGRVELQATLDAEGVIAVHDELCNQEYRFAAGDLARIFSD